MSHQIATEGSVQRAHGMLRLDEATSATAVTCDSTPALEQMLTSEELLGKKWPATDALAELCRYAVAHTGKQLRSRLVREAGRLGVSEHPDLHAATRAVELLHVATLVHDDVIDDSPLRRGRASLNSGFGGVAAAYTGAWLLAIALELVTECGDQAVGLFAGTARDLCNGEMRESQDLFNISRNEDDYFTAVAKKTASLFSLSARLGGVTCGASDAVCAELGRYGHLVGVAFQLADDVLDLLGDCNGLKRCGDDLRHGILTLPVIYAIRADPSLRAVIDREIDDDAVAAVVEAAHSTGAFSKAFAVCERQRTAAREVAQGLGAPWLEAFADEAFPAFDAVRSR
jgi:heptaprenyl diphosphate synthase